MSDSDLLTRLNRATDALTAAGCRRIDGVWTDAQGAELASDPLAAAKALRRRTIARVVEAKRERGESFTR